MSFVALYVRLNSLQIVGNAILNFCLNHFLVSSRKSKILPTFDVLYLSNLAVLVLRKLHYDIWKTVVEDGCKNIGMEISTVQFVFDDDFNGPREG